MVSLVFGIVLVVAGGVLLGLNLTGTVTPDLVATPQTITPVAQAGILIIVGLSISTIFAIGLTGKSEED